MSSNDTSRVWDGVYSTFSEAAAEGAVFEQTIWLEKIVERARQSVMQSGGAAAVASIAVTSDYALPFVAASIACCGRPLRILDFGGGMGASFLSLVKMLSADQSIDFVIVENSAVCKAGQKFFKEDSRISFREDVPSPDDSYDIIHCGSSLHYVDDWKGLLDRFALLQPAYILFADLPAADNQSFVTTQMYYGQRIPVHFWNLDEFASCVLAQGYELILKSRYRGYYLDRDADLPTAHFDPDHRLTYLSQLIFHRSANP
jgi:putative methyltransferase (TIGR04325 family)